MPEKQVRLITSESVTEGHPDKVCDQISDGIYDEMLRIDPMSRSAVETFCTTGLVIVGGEVTTKAYVNIDKVVREVLRDIGYDKQEYGFCCDDVGVLVSIHEQSPDIAQGVDEGKGEFKEQGAGDQGLMIGYATNEIVIKPSITIPNLHALTLVESDGNSAIVIKEILSSLGDIFAISHFKSPFMMKEELSSL